MSEAASLAFKDKNTAGLYTLAQSRGTIWNTEAVSPFVEQ